MSKGQAAIWGRRCLEWLLQGTVGAFTINIRVFWWMASTGKKARARFGARRRCRVFISDPSMTTPVHGGFRVSSPTLLNAMRQVFASWGSSRVWKEDAVGTCFASFHDQVRICKSVKPHDMQIENWSQCTQFRLLRDFTFNMLEEGSKCNENSVCVYVHIYIYVYKISGF